MHRFTIRRAQFRARNPSGGICVNPKACLTVCKCPDTEEISQWVSAQAAACGGITIPERGNDSMVGDYFQNVWTILGELGPWLLFGVAAAGVLHVFLPSDFVRSHLGSGTMRNVIKASLFGVPMPLCSCGVIPAAIGLRRDGASKGAATAFLVSTPQTGLDSVTVSAVFLGLPFALYKVVVAFLTGLLGGALVNAGEHVRGHREILQPTGGTRKGSGAQGRLADWFEFAVDDLLYAIWKWIVLGVLISAAISTFLPQNALADKPWATGLAGMLLMLLVSLPLYVCATASVPIAASLVHAGMPVGAALVFLMAGPATNIATLGAVYSEFGRRVTGVYIGVIAVASIFFGWLFDAIGGSSFRTMEGVVHEPRAWNLVGAVILLALFAWFAARDLRNRIRRSSAAPADEHGRTVKMHVDDMSCENCARDLRLALQNQHGVRRVDIDMDEHAITVHGQGLQPHQLHEAVAEAGYVLQEH